jgi:hypothetical protein
MELVLRDIDDNTRRYLGTLACWEHSCKRGYHSTRCALTVPIRNCPAGRSLAWCNHQLRNGIINSVSKLELGRCDNKACFERVVGLEHWGHEVVP